ncbi:MAG TPA: hypothetical protein VHU91_09385 [Mycobacteriales bacterium]|nr:hypothetical protein [Mycobacteriales bacterium]
MQLRTKIAVTSGVIGIGVLAAAPARADDPPPPASVTGQQAPPPADAPLWTAD